MAFSSSPFASERAPGAGVTAVLGPTNTGKTHLAIERMLAHPSGMIGLPLRLLAREVYNKIADRAGAESVALVTGEEKIKPKNPRYWVSTVEAMPRDLDVSFLAVDEVQIASDLERGHVFTDRILNRRGRDETLLLGAATMRPIIERLLPGVSMITRPRLSQLEFAGDRKITRQPRRTAIVAFSADEVYAIAELIRRQHGGAAVVLGSLSPRTRNAQVAMFQNGDVDYLVATDAVGMGLNLDVDHVAFASDRKFDGYQFRRLTPAEFAQIAGRAGRATRNGTFGTTGRCAPFEPELVNALQNHTFDPVKVLQWRNSKLDFASLGALQVSLNLAPGHEALTRAPVAEDMRVLDHAARDVEVRDIAHGKTAVERLWEACQVPDYRKLSPAAHAELVTTLYGFLMRKGCIPDSWFEAQITQADRIDGDIDTLSARIAQIRTWTFVANRPDWLKDPERWQGIAREVENKLSDALHERLTERFVDRRTSVLMRRLRENTSLNTEIGKTGEVIVEGHVIGRLDGFTFAPDAAEAGSDAKALQAAAQAVLAGEINARAEKLGNAPDEQFVLTSEGTIRWTGDAVARLSAAEEALHPRIRIISDERLTGAPRDKVQARLELWLKTHIEKLLGPMFELSKAEDVTGIARGIAYQLVEALGVLERPKIANELKDLDQPSRAVLRKYGVRFGAYHIYFPGLLKPAARALAALLWALKQDNVDLSSLSGAQHLASSGRTSFPVDKALPRDAYRVLGYKQAGERAVRVDILERLADLIRPALAWRENSPGEKPAGAFDGRSFVVTQAMTSLTGSAGEDFASVLRALGYRMDKRPPLPPKPVVAEPVATEQVVTETIAAETPPVEGSAETSTETAAEAVAGLPEEASAEAAAEAVTVEDAPGLEQQDESAQAEPALDASPEAPVTPEDAPGIAPPAEETAASPEAAGLEAAAAETVATEAAASPDAAAPEAAAAPAEPELVEVWRPGGRHEDRKPRHERHRHQRHHRPRPQAGAEAGAAASAAPGEATDGARPGERHRHGGHRRDSGKDFRKGREGGEGGERRDDRNRSFQGKDRDKDRDRNRDNKGKFGGERDKGREHRGRDRDKGRDRQGGPSLRPYASSANPRERDRPADPNSPFAKLAALKEQLSGRKE
ncbi:helicase-related protein [Bradyrhizobium sp. 1(2017)]|uniref:helicase-related protein n=1 Tax=Bradyrhizobium sp. 1(2017) TaxID=1404888 RepID=UPI00140F153B|nr:helicase-related protein [Bradyrhizobium sp. 1(2017)]QIO36986.1 helicase [Bradyrhizobium sp. 1(2017)]